MESVSIRISNGFNNIVSVDILNHQRKKRRLRHCYKKIITFAL